MQNRIEENRKTWNTVAEEFLEASALPMWGPFGVGDDLNLISEIEGKVFLEIACGSGRSIKYLTKKSAKKVYGLDLSEEQVKEATKYNKNEIGNGEVEMIHGQMEQKLDIEPVDIVFSVYGIGWTQNPERTFKNIFSYLKTGGKFIWSWDHSIYTDISYKDGEYVVTSSYHNEEPVIIKSWKDKHGVNAHVTYRKTSTWFKLLKETGFEIVGYYEPKPKTIERGYTEPEKYYSIKKAELIPATCIFECIKR
jgi:SAM-dependent methyltransferase